MRMLRAVAMAARLASRSIRRSTQAIAAHRGEIARSAPARLIEEFYKLLRSGAAEQAFRMLAERRLLEPIAQELQTRAGDAPLAIAGGARRLPPAVRGHPRHADQRRSSSDRCSCRSVHAAQPVAAPVVDGEPREGAARSSLGMLPLARRDVERLRQILGLQRRLIDMNLSPRAQARADAPRAVPRGADLAGDSRPGAGSARALARLHRSGGHLRRRGRGGAEPRSAAAAAGDGDAAPTTRADAGYRSTSQDAGPESAVQSIPASARTPA